MEPKLENYRVPATVMENPQHFFKWEPNAESLLKQMIIDVCRRHGIRGNLLVEYWQDDNSGGSYTHKVTAYINHLSVISHTDSIATMHTRSPAIPEHLLKDVRNRAMIALVQLVTEVGLLGNIPGRKEIATPFEFVPKADHVRLLDWRC